MDADVAPVHEVTDELVAAMARLLPQLAPSAAALDARRLQQIVDADATTVLVARTADGIVGTLTLVLFVVPTGRRARIEDVVVDRTARGRGIGAALTLEAVRFARAAGARTIDLTSRPSRQAANRLYERLGFNARESRVYRYSRQL
jgi:ribosomal protein S18 acetylase RimI-like enzyme